MRTNRWLGVVVSVGLISTSALAQQFSVFNNNGPNNVDFSLSQSNSGPTSGAFTNAQWTLTDTSFGGTGNGWRWSRDVSAFSSGDPFGRLVLRFDGFGGTSAGSYWRLPANRSGGLTGNNPSGVVLHTTWVGSGHVFRSEQLSNKPAFGGDVTTNIRAQANNAAPINKSSGPSGLITGIPDDDPAAGIQVNKFLNPSITINWSVFGAVASRGQVAGGAYFGAINSPFRDDVRVTGNLQIGSTVVQSGSNSVTFAVNEGPATKSIASFGNSFTLDLTSYGIGDIVTVRVNYAMLWDGYHDVYAGTVQLNSGFEEIQFEVVPEPASLIALGTGLISLLSLRRRNR